MSDLRFVIDFNYRKSTKDGKQVEIFTDGSCTGIRGHGGYGAILRYRGHEKTFE